MPNAKKDPRSARSKTLTTKGGRLQLYSLQELASNYAISIERLPYSIKVLLESALRSVDGFTVTEEDIRAIATWEAKKVAQREVPFIPARVLLQDFTGVPCLVDLAAMRDAMKRLGGDPGKINPSIPVDLVIDHSVQVDSFGSADALGINADREFARNLERYQFLRWGQNAVDGFRVVPDLVGLVHRVGLAQEDDAPISVAACELVLEALVARKKISRSDGGQYGRATPEPRRRPNQDLFGGGLS